MDNFIQKCPYSPINELPQGSYQTVFICVQKTYRTPFSLYIHSHSITYESPGFNYERIWLTSCHQQTVVDCNQANAVRWYVYRYLWLYIQSIYPLRQLTWLQHKTLELCEYWKRDSARLHKCCGQFTLSETCAKYIISLVNCYIYNAARPMKFTRYWVSGFQHSRERWNPLTIRQYSVNIVLVWIRDL